MPSAIPTGPRETTPTLTGPRLTRHGAPAGPKFANKSRSSLPTDWNCGKCGFRNATISLTCHGRPSNGLTCATKRENGRNAVLGGRIDKAGNEKGGLNGLSKIDAALAKLGKNVGEGGGHGGKGVAEDAEEGEVDEMGGDIKTPTDHFEEEKKKMEAAGFLRKELQDSILKEISYEQALATQRAQTGHLRSLRVDKMTLEGIDGILRRKQIAEARKFLAAREFEGRALAVIAAELRDKEEQSRAVDTEVTVMGSG